MKAMKLIAARLAKQQQQMMLFTYNGMAVRFDEANVRSMGRMARGVKGVTLRNERDYIVGCEVVNGDEAILVVCENGFGKRSYVEDFRQTNRGGVGVRSIITSERNGNVVGALCVTDSDGMVMMSSTGQTVRISMRDLRVMGRNTQGVRLANLRDNDYLVAIQKIEEVVGAPDQQDAPPESLADDSEAEGADGLQEMNVVDEE